ncbi:MAG: hypothetical protein ACE5DN_06685 [Flavobacteriales bacterium]
MRPLALWRPVADFGKPANPDYLYRMILIADSGSSKTDWVALSGGAERAFQTRGLNPFFTGTEEISRAVADAISGLLHPGEVTSLWFYGAGCSDAVNCGQVQQALAAVFPAARIEVAHDLLGAARACFGREAGIACILGTGSNSCLFDGEKIADHIPALGYMLGDEGSGSHLGKTLLRAFLYRELPEPLAAEFKKTYRPDTHALLRSLYSDPSPNRQLATFAPFLTKHLNDTFIREMATACFNAFFTHHVLKYEGVRTRPVSFVGSVAFHFEPLLRETAARNGIRMADVIRKPIERLCLFHAGE